MVSQPGQCAECSWYSAAKSLALCFLFDSTENDALFTIAWDIRCLYLDQEITFQAKTVCFVLNVNDFILAERNAIQKLFCVLITDRKGNQ